MCNVSSIDGIAVEKIDVKYGEGIIMMNDPIADVLTRMRNASMQRARFVDVCGSRVIMNILCVFQERGFIVKIKDISESSHDAEKNNKQGKKFRVFLKYYRGKEPAFENIQRLSKLSRRVYVPHQKIPIIRNGIGSVIMTTSKGIMDGYKAKKNKVGGECICAIW